MRKRSALDRIALVGALVTGLAATVLTAAAPSSAATAASTSVVGTSFTGAALNPNQSRPYCFDYANYAYYGPVSVSAESIDYFDVTLTLVSTDVRYASGRGWIYCATVRNDSSRNSGPVSITQRSNLAATGRQSLAEGYLAPNSQKQYCFSLPGRPDPGPVLVNARSSTQNDTLRTVSTSLEHRANYGWVYCAWIDNVSSVGGDVTLDTAINPYSSNSWADTGLYLQAGQQNTFCFYYPFGVKPTVATAAAYEYGVQLETLSISRDDPIATPSESLWCAVVRNDSAIPSGFTLQTSAGVGS